MNWKRKASVGAIGLASLVGNAGCVDVMLWGAGQAISHHRSQKNKAVDNRQAAEISKLRWELNELKAQQGQGNMQQDQRNSVQYPVLSEDYIAKFEDLGAVEDQEYQQGPLNMQLSAHIGISPMKLGYRVEVPDNLLRGADVLWIYDGEPLSRGFSGQRELTIPGRHKIEVLVVSKDNDIYGTSKIVTVLERLELKDN